MTNENQLSPTPLTLFIGRISSYFFQKIHKSYGHDYLVDCMKHFKGQSGRLSRINKHLSKQLDGFSSQRQLNLDAFYFESVSDYWTDYSSRSMRGAHALQEFLLDGSYQSCSPFEKAKLTISCVGSLTAYTMLKNETLEPTLKAMPSKLPELIFKGMEIKKALESIVQIQNYAHEVKLAGLTNILCWLINWSFATFYYRNGDFKRSYEYYKDAFHQAKYKAGKDQYSLVNQFIESCAKNRKLSEMKKAVAWAYYIGLEVRWIRNFEDPESKKSLKFLYDFMGNENMRYAHV